MAQIRLILIVVRGLRAAIYKLPTKAGHGDPHYDVGGVAGHGEHALQWVEGCICMKFYRLIKVFWYKLKFRVFPQFLHFLLNFWIKSDNFEIV